MEVYFDQAATSHPKPEAVVQAVQRAMTDLNANPGRSGHRRALAAAREVLACREALAELLGAPEVESIVFCANCTDALNLAIKGSLRQGDHVVASVLEHNSVLRVLTELARSGQIELTLVEPEPSGEVSPERIRASIRHNTTLCALTHASNVTGAVQPVAAVGRMLRALGVRFLIDGAQALGHLPVDVRALACDLYAFPGHKGLLGPQGSGGLYISPAIELRTLREGGTGSSSDSMRQPLERPERYESGTVNLPGIAGLCAGARYVRARLNEIRAHDRALTETLIHGLREIGGATVYAPADPSARVGVVSFNLEDLNSSQVADQLDARGIAVRGGLHCAPGAHQWLGTMARGAVRASVGYFNTMEEADDFLDAVREIARGG